MNPDFRAADFGGADIGGQRDPLECDPVEALALTDPAGLGELPPEHFDAWIDRLVDGEVAEPQRRALLSRLERSPEGWRHCALAFLEAQAWRDALEPQAVGAAYVDSKENDGSKESTSPANETPGRTIAPLVPINAPHRLAWQWRPLLGIVAAAASFMVAFGLGLLVQRAWLSANSHNSAMTGTVDVSPRSTSLDPGSVAGVKPTQWGTVQFVVDGPTGSPEQVRLPAVEGPDPAQWLREQPPAIPDEIVQELRRHGHHVQTQRRYVPVPLDDGRSAVFPFDQVEVRFRGGNGYQ